MIYPLSLTIALIIASRFYPPQGHMADGLIQAPCLSLFFGSLIFLKWWSIAAGLLLPPMVGIVRECQRDRVRKSAKSLKAPSVHNFHSK